MPPSRPSPAWGDILLTAIAPVLWGTTYILASEVLPPGRPFMSALIRVLPAGLLLVLLMVGTRINHFAPIPDASWAVFFIGGFYLRSWTRWAFPLLMALAVAAFLELPTGSIQLLPEERAAGLSFSTHMLPLPMLRCSMLRP